jgi:hypothetical protein
VLEMWPVLESPCTLAGLWSFAFNTVDRRPLKLDRKPPKPLEIAHIVVRAVILSAEGTLGPLLPVRSSRKSPLAPLLAASSLRGG